MPPTLGGTFLHAATLADELCYVVDAQTRFFVAFARCFNLREDIFIADGDAFPALLRPYFRPTTPSGRWLAVMHGIIEVERARRTKNG